MSRFVLLPADEHELIRWVTAKHDVVASATFLDAAGDQRLDALPPLPVDLPGSADEPGLPHELVLRAPGWGINDLPPWDDDSPTARVRRVIARGSSAADPSPDDEPLDVERTRVVRLRRSSWTPTGRLRLAALQGSARPTRLQDPAVTSLLRSVERWLSRGAVRVEPPPGLVGRKRILARPEAARWVEAGGVVHPWEA